MVKLRKLSLVLLIGLPLIIAAACSEQKSGYQYKETAQLVDLVKDGAALVEKDGEKAFAEFKKEGSKWRQGENYIFVLDTEGNVPVHPDPALEGKNRMNLKDVNGKVIIKRMVEEATGYKGKTEGWSSYLWPKPGEIFHSWKTSFVKLAKAPSGKNYIVGSGLYNMKMEPSFVEDEVKEAVELIETKGKAAFDILRDPASEFLFHDTYVFVFARDGTDLVHPGFKYLEGQNVMDLRDSEGKYLVREFFDVVDKQGSGWVDYMWPKPGDSVPAKKSTFVTRAKMGDTWVLVGSGVYMK